MGVVHKILRWFDRTGNLISVFVLVMLVPNLVLAITEPFSATTILASVLLPAGFYLLWAVAAKRPGVMILWALPWMILGAFQLVITYLFGSSIIAVDMFTNLFTTSVSEAGELLGSIYPSVIIVILLYVPLLLLAVRSVRRKQRTDKRQRTMAAIAALCLLVLGGGMAAISKYRNPEFGVKYHVFPASVCHNMKLSAGRWKMQARYPQMSEGFSFGAVRNKPDSAGREIYVFVIGEASRAASWSLFGYEKETTPLLSARRGIVPLRDMITQSNTTHKSVPLMLSSEAADTYDSVYRRKSVLTLFGEAGFRTAFISNQPANRSLIDYFAAQADTLIDITSHDIMGGQHFDGETVKPLRSLIDATDDDLFVVIHTYGSHADHYKRYPEEFARFLPDRAKSVSRRYREPVRNAYDNTVVYTDHVLSEIISTLDAADAATALLYTADHGEDVLDDRRNRYLHASPRTTYYQLHVASFLWFSDEYTALFPGKAEAAARNSEQPANTSSMLSTLAGMAEIGSPYIDASRSLVSDAFTPYQRMYIDDYNRADDVVNSGLTDEDLRLFDLHGLVYDSREIDRKKF